MFLLESQTFQICASFIKPCFQGPENTYLGENLKYYAKRSSAAPDGEENVTMFMFTKISNIQKNASLINPVFKVPRTPPSVKTLPG